MIVRYTITFRFVTRPPLTHQGTLSTDQALNLVALLLEPNEPIAHIPPPITADTSASSERSA